MKLDVHPLAALCDQKVEMHISGLPPLGKVKVSASMSLPWAKSVIYASAAWFTADPEGQVDCSRQKPNSGSYDFADSTGLIVSMKSPDPHAMEKIARNISIDESLFINMIAESGQEQAVVRLERWFKTPDIQRLRIMDEFVGEFFYTGLPGRPTILWLGGSGSNLEVNALIAAPLASHGFNVLSLPYFGEKGLPASLSGIPLEYFERVFTWLEKNPLTTGKEVQVLGMSKGAELALILASRYSFIKKVAVWAPHAYCFQGIAYKNESSWMYQGKPLPYIRARNSWVFAEIFNGMLRNQPFRFTPVYRKALALAKNRAAARIRVEDAQADLLLVTSTDCGMWNTYDGCMEIMDTLKKQDYPHSYDLVVYKDAGEPYLVPYVIPVSESSVQMAPRLVLSMGGTMEGNARAQAGAWEKAIAFFSQGENQPEAGSLFLTNHKESI